MRTFEFRYLIFPFALGVVSGMFICMYEGRVFLASHQEEAPDLLTVVEWAAELEEQAALGLAELVI